MPAAHTIGDFLEELSLRRPDVEYVSGYRSYSSKEGVTVRSVACGHVWHVGRASYLFDKHARCPECRRDAIENVSISHDEFCQRVESSFPHIKVIGRFSDFNEEIEYQCVKCGRVMSSKASNLFTGDAKLHVSRCDTRRFSIGRETLISCLENGLRYADIAEKMGCSVRAVESNVDWYGLRNYRKKTRAENDEREKHESDILKRSGIEHIISTTDDIPFKEVEKTIRRNNPAFLFSDDFSTTHSVSAIECKSCGHSWNDVLGRYVRPQACPNCASRFGTSFAEMVIFIAMSIAMGETIVKHRDKNGIGHELDIYVPSKSFAVEYGSWYYHGTDAILEKDEKKRVECAKRGIRLITIYDACDDDTVDDDDVWKIGVPLSYGKNIGALDDVISKLCSLIGGRFDSNLTYDACEIAKEWLANDERANVEKLILEKHPNVHMVGTYVNASTPARFMCTSCGNTWEAPPKRLLYGAGGCRRCSYRENGLARRKTIEEFSKQVSARFPDVVVESDSYAPYEPVSCACQRGHKWSALPATILNKNYRGCPMCVREAKAESRRAEFADAVNGSGIMTLMSEYVDSKTKVKVKWNECGHVEEVLPGSIMRRKRCNVCGESKPRVSQSEFEKRVHKNYPNVVVKSCYNGFDSEVTCSCAEHRDVEWTCKAEALTRGRLYGCPKCAEEHSNGLGIGRRFMREQMVLGKSIEEISKETSIPVSYLSRYV